METDAMKTESDLDFDLFASIDLVKMEDEVRPCQEVRVNHC
jgi:hypothetical protein